MEDRIKAEAQAADAEHRVAIRMWDEAATAFDNERNDRYALLSAAMDQCHTAYDTERGETIWGEFDDHMMEIGTATPCQHVPIFCRNLIEAHKEHIDLIWEMARDGDL